MITQQPAHAKHRPPSAAKRWLSCHASAYVTPMYPNEESDKSKLGDLAHNLLENALTFGIMPDTSDPDMDLNIADVVAWVKAKRKEYTEKDGKCDLYVEVRLDIPYTEEFGTADIVFVTPKRLHVADYKNGYVAVNAKMNPQMNTYLLGAIAKFGERSRYTTTVIQPNYNHIDGPFRSYEVTPENLEWFIIEVQQAVREGYEGRFAPGTHCKDTYCPHRASCVDFHTWARTDASKAWYPSEVNGLDDIQLSQALDHADVLQGIRDELRKEAMRRIINMDRHVEGYKIVRSRTNREFKGDEGRAAAYAALLQMGYTPEQIVERKPITVGDVTIYEQSTLSVKGVEDMVKQKFKSFGRGKWKEIWDEYISPHVLDYSGSLTLERAIDGRPAHSRGSEFGAITPPAQPNPSQAGQVTII